VGVAPRNFRGTNALVHTDLWVPMMMYTHIYPMADWVDRRKALIFQAVARLRDGIGPRQKFSQPQQLSLLSGVDLPRLRCCQIGRS
jgi:hypothetical protein